MSILESTFNCQNCSKTLWLKYYKLPDGRIVCPKCYDEIDKQMNRKKEIENY
jgi:formylmethanofuran dehydrogenase subunit E